MSFLQKLEIQSLEQKTKTPTAKKKEASKVIQAVRDISEQQATINKETHIQIMKLSQQVLECQNEVGKLQT
jgi:hypothetical protein